MGWRRLASQNLENTNWPVLMKESFEQGKSAFFKHDILVVDGVHNMYDEDQKALVIVPR